MAEILLILALNINQSIRSKFVNYRICSRHDMAEILLKLALSINQSFVILQDIFSVEKCDVLVIL